MRMKPLLYVAGSKESVVAPLEEPTRKWPPFFGACANSRPAEDSDSAEPMPIADAAFRNDLRSSRPSRASRSSSVNLFMCLLQLPHGLVGNVAAAFSRRFAGFGLFQDPFSGSISLFSIQTSRETRDCQDSRGGPGVEDSVISAMA